MVRKSSLMDGFNGIFSYLIRTKPSLPAPSPFTFSTNARRLLNKRNSPHFGGFTQPTLRSSVRIIQRCLFNLNNFFAKKLFILSFVSSPLCVLPGNTFILTYSIKAAIGGFLFFSTFVKCIFLFVTIGKISRGSNIVNKVIVMFLERLLKRIFLRVSCDTCLSLIQSIW